MEAPVEKAGTKEHGRDDNNCEEAAKPEKEFFQHGWTIDEATSLSFACFSGNFLQFRLFAHPRGPGQAW